MLKDKPLSSTYPPSYIKMVRIGFYHRPAIDFTLLYAVEDTDRDPKEYQAIRTFKDPRYCYYYEINA